MSGQPHFNGTFVVISSIFIRDAWLGCSHLVFGSKLCRRFPNASLLVLSISAVSLNLCFSFLFFLFHFVRSQKLLMSYLYSINCYALSLVSVPFFPLIESKHTCSYMAINLRLDSSSHNAIIFLTMISKI